MAKKVAVDGEVSASPGTSPGIEGSTGTWTKKGDVSYETYDHLTVRGKKVAYEAKCSFSYSGSTPSGPVGPKDVDVTLSAEATVLQSGTDKVLADGDSAEDSYGNKLSVSAQGVLQTA